MKKKQIRQQKKTKPKKHKKLIFHFFKEFILKNQIFKFLI